MKEDKQPGRPLKIADPEAMMMWFLRYKEWAKDNPIKKNDFRGGAAKEVILLLERPLSQSGFEVFVAKESHYTILGIEQYFSNREGRYEQFVAICSISASIPSSC